MSKTINKFIALIVSLVVLLGVCYVNAYASGWEIIKSHKDDSFTYYYYIGTNGTNLYLTKNKTGTRNDSYKTYKWSNGDWVVDDVDECSLTYKTTYDGMNPLPTSKPSYASTYVNLNGVTYAWCCWGSASGEHDYGVLEKWAGEATATPASTEDEEEVNDDESEPEDEEEAAVDEDDEEFVNDEDTKPTIIQSGSKVTITYKNAFEFTYYPLNFEEGAKTVSSDSSGKLVLTDLFDGIWEYELEDSETEQMVYGQFEFTKSTTSSDTTSVTATFSTDGYQRLVIKSSRKSFKFGYSEDGKSWCYGNWRTSNGTLVVDDDFVPGKTYYYKLSQNGDVIKSGTFSITKKFVTANTASKVKSTIGDGVLSRKKVIGLYSTLTASQIKSYAKAVLGSYHISGKSVISYTYHEPLVKSCNPTMITQKISGTTYRLYRLELKYKTNKTTQNKLMNSIDARVENQMNLKGTRKKICKLDKWLVNNCSYDYAAYNSKKYKTNLSGYPQNVATKKKAVCSGFAWYIKMCCVEKGIPCKVVSWKNHAWNVIKVGKKWYHVDATWDICSGYGKYILKGCNDSKFNSEHKITSGFYTKYLSKSKFGAKNLSTKY